MKKLITGFALTCLASTAFAASDAYKLDVQLTKDGAVVGAYSAILDDNVTGHYENSQIRPITDWIEIDDKGNSHEKSKPLKVGFIFSGTPRKMSDGKVLLSYDFEYTQLLEMRHEPVADNVNMLLPDTATLAFSSSMFTENGEPVLVKSENQRGKFELSMTVTKQ
ncbi:hypothetical protein [Aquipseudomonas alcaligenes]|uniref:Fimbrial assembly protein n=1 Tax=Aquipseudomonas alcaligenes TaxID=43263 RepID=A0AA37FNE1_AQUAC|nr:hypothetical protein [Pseudomonas alcaligenes]BCR26224.1 hypothetical protein KAM426_37510 [Pseudomonas alcaligenes]GIZ68768.1 hypothetical protein KAM428_38530 [Pseudomonas alcaligenes]GIZ73152.1 hypothetical protein KAM429_39130 [Pseudomonas alcaligenes]GIZ77531.1 hypothetical protein KAM430_39400 [Pseudomonas alcaligenes]GIZ81840.1 hypothetical protein KAM432_38880 [Pseudomonas alcaligenes]